MQNNVEYNIISKDHLRVNPFLATFVNREDNEDAEICYDSDVGCFSWGFEIAEEHLNRSLVMLCLYST